jgi:hypothetical protein
MALALGHEGWRRGCAMITGAWMWPEAYSVCLTTSFAAQSGGVVVLPSSSVPVSSSQTHPIFLHATRSICALSARCGVSRRAKCEACPITVLTEAPACALAAGQHCSSSASSFLPASATRSTRGAQIFNYIFQSSDFQPYQLSVRNAAVWQQQCDVAGRCRDRHTCL